MRKTLIALAVLTTFSAHATDGIWVEGTLQEGTALENLVVDSANFVEGWSTKTSAGVLLRGPVTGNFTGTTSVNVKDENTEQTSGIAVMNGAIANFDALETNITVESKGKALHWGFGVIAEGKGSAVNFNGGDVSIKMTQHNYTSQTFTVAAGAAGHFNNSGDVTIESYSPYGITVVDAHGELTFDNEGSVLLKGAIIPGDMTAQTNVVGIQGDDTTWFVTDKVQELKIDLSGAGVDNNGTSYSTGTKGIAATNVDFEVQAKKFTITMNVGSDVEDNSPDGHTSVKAYGIYADSGSMITIGTNTETCISVNEGLGTAYGIYITDGASLNAKGNTNVVVEGTDGAKALFSDGENSTVTLVGKQNRIFGDVVASKRGAMNFVSGNTSITGEVLVDADSVMSLEMASVELDEGSTMTINGSLQSTEGQIILNDATAGTVSIASLTDGSSLEAVASGSLNDKLGGDLNAFNDAITITQGAEGTTLVMKEGLVAGEKTAQLTEEGKIDETTVTEKTNSVMESSLEMAASMPLAMNRILTNDVRKRMGDLRASNGTHGAWARYDGGKLSGENGLDSEFHTIQVGIDTVASADAPRVGVAFAYTDGDMDYVRNSSDMQAYSLAGYATWMADNGMFLDTVVRMSKFDNDLTVDGCLKGQMDSLAVGVSAEGGWRFDLTDMFYVEPQAEVAYTYINGDDFTLGEASYKVEGLDSLTGRLGFASGIKCPNNKGDVYLRASVVHEFLGDSKITGTASGSTGIVEIDGKDTWVEYGLGANFNLTDTTYFWADVERTSGSYLDEDWRATVGVRHAF